MSEILDFADYTRESWIIRDIRHEDWKEQYPNGIWNFNLTVHRLRNLIADELNDR